MGELNQDYPKTPQEAAKTLGMKNSEQVVSWSVVGQELQRRKEEEKAQEGLRAIENKEE